MVNKTCVFETYLTEIEKMDLMAHEKLLLQIAAAFKVDNLDYEKLKKKFESYKIQRETIK